MQYVRVCHRESNLQAPLDDTRISASGSYTLGTLEHAYSWDVGTLGAITRGLRSAGNNGTPFALATSKDRY